MMPKDRYEILGALGCGATSRVDKARDTVLGRTVALKTLVHAFGAPVEQKQFLREAQIVSQLSHPAIVSLYDVGIEDENVAYLVMEYVSGKTLQQVLSESSIPFPRACGASLGTSINPSSRGSPSSPSSTSAFFATIGVTVGSCCTYSARRRRCRKASLPDVKPP